MATARATKLLLPGIFLLLLGVGNIAVGKFKVEQYQEVLDELTAGEFAFAETLANDSALARIQATARRANRLFQKQEKALARLDFYQVVIFGGKIFVGLSMPFFLLSAMFKIHSLKQS